MGGFVCKTVNLHGYVCTLQGTLAPGCMGVQISTEMKALPALKDHSFVHLHWGTATLPFFSFRRPMRVMQAFITSVSLTVGGLARVRCTITVQYSSKFGP